MVNKCSVGGCKTNYVGHDTDAVFSFPKDPDLFGRWKRFCNRLNWEPTLPRLGKRQYVTWRQFFKNWIKRDKRKTA